MMEMTGTQVTLRGPRTYNDLERAENVGNGEWRSSCSSSFQAAGSMGRAQLLLAWLGDNASMEKAMELRDWDAGSWTLMSCEIVWGCGDGECTQLGNS